MLEERCALRHAPSGMTKTEIGVEVSDRHASSADTDEALRLLSGLHMAYYRVEVIGVQVREQAFT